MLKAVLCGLQSHAGNKIPMQIANNTVVSFHYKLEEVGGEYKEDSGGGDPMLYLHGHRGILPGLEDAMKGKVAGDKFSVQVPPENGYGLRRDNSVQRVPVKHLIGQKKPKLGELVTVNAKTGKVNATVVKVGRHNVDVDTNHPLAGKELKFDIEVVDVREATMDEVSHRHAHGPGGHQH